MKAAIAYVLSRYPLLTETFILREMLAMRALGHEIRVMPLRRARAVRQHPGVGQLAEAVFWPSWKPGVWARGYGRLLAMPAARATWSRLAWGSRKDSNLLAGAALYWPQAARMAEACRAAKITHLHAHFATHPAMAAMAVHRLTGIPFSFTVHAHDLFEHPAMLREKIEAAAFVAAISEYNRRELVRLAPAATAKIRVIHCGVATEIYAEMAQRRHCAGSQIDRGRKLQLLCVAALRPYKGHARLLEACARLKPELDFELRLTGDGPERARLEQLSRRLGLEAQVRFSGWRTEPEVRQQLACADAFVLASQREPGGRMDGIPVALMEAMAAGLPVIAGRLSGIPELVASGENGWLFDPESTDQLCHALRLLQDLGLRRDWGDAGRRKVMRDFDLTGCARQLSEAIAGCAPAQPWRSNSIEAGTCR